MLDRVSRIAGQSAISIARKLDVVINYGYPWRFRNFRFYPSITSTGLVRAYNSLETEKRFKEKRRKKRPEEERGKLEKEI